MATIAGEHPAPAALALARLRDIPLDEMPAADGAILDEAIACLLPETVVAPVPVAAFQSAI